MSQNGADNRTTPSFDIELGLLARAMWPIAGVDEAGRGPLAGPVAVAAVGLDPHDIPPGPDGSKALSAAAPGGLYAAILRQTLAGFVVLAAAARNAATNNFQGTVADNL